MFPDSKTELEYASTEDAPDTAKLLTKVVRLMLTFESLKRILPPTSDAASPANSEAIIVLPIALAVGGALILPATRRRRRLRSAG